MSIPDAHSYICIEHVRSFSKQQRIPLRPLTILVGENSSGKSTFLSVVASIFNGKRFPFALAFNQSPFNLGTFETIATYKGGKYGRDDQFTIGYSNKQDSNSPQEMHATYGSKDGVPGLAALKYENAIATLDLQFAIDGVTGKLVFNQKKTSRPDSIQIKVAAEIYDWGATSLGAEALRQMILSSIDRKIQSRMDLVSDISHFIRAMRLPFHAVIPFAPIRTKPKRTYDELVEGYSPEGDHIPKVLARVFKDGSSSHAEDEVRKALITYGVESGLFQRISIKKSFGRSPDDPFQVRIGVGGPEVNLVDVGYGVSQAIPLIVESMMQERHSLLLVQQPEVHLHPRAQAALGTFFGNLIQSGRHSLIVETHSDYLLDRVRIEVANGKIKSEDVQILFFSKPNTDTRVYPIEIDKDGNVCGAPNEYRSFFLKEEMRLFQGGD